MENAKERARTVLIRRLNDFKPDESVAQVIDEVVDEMWSIFENNRLFGENELHGKKAYVKKS